MLMNRMSWREFRNSVYPYDRPAPEISAVSDRKCSAVTLTDSRCFFYGIIDEEFIRKHQLEHVQIPSVDINGYGGPRGYKIAEVAKGIPDEAAGEEHIAMLYIALHIPNYDMILGLPWMVYRINPNREQGPQLEFAIVGSP